MATLPGASGNFCVTGTTVEQPTQLKRIKIMQATNTMVAKG
jgi:hypothetical protein